MLVFRSCKTFVEKENALTYYGDYTDEQIKGLVSEIKDLYDWWLQRKDKTDDSFASDSEDDKMLNRLMKIRLSLWI